MDFEQRGISLKLDGVENSIFIHPGTESRSWSQDAMKFIGREYITPEAKAYLLRQLARLTFRVFL